MGKKAKIIASLVIVAAVTGLAGWYLHHTSIPVLEPRGWVALQERNLMILVTLLMLIVVIPVFILTFFIAWKYRAGREHTRYMPDWDHNRIIEAIWWLIPTALIVVLSVVTWRATHELDPYRPLAAKEPQMVVQVVALNWKWLFIYPQQNVASVNLVQLPVNTPVDFEITADAPMNSFWIPQLGGQIYAMAGMATQMHLIANKLGDFYGSSANISGTGFAGMHFIARASSNSAFQTWVNNIKMSAKPLTLAAYNHLAANSINNPVSFYSSPASGLYYDIIGKYMDPMPTNMNANMSSGMSM